MSDAARGPATGDGPDADALVAELADASDALQRARRRVDAVGEDELTALGERYRELTRLFDRYEEEVTGDGDFQTFIEFQGKVAEFTERLPGDRRHREVFEDVDDLLQQRRLTESDWRQVRETLAPVRDDVERLEDRQAARERYQDARYDVERRRDAVTDRIEDLERLERLGDADLDAPTERLRDPVETYNEQVSAAFETFTSEASARTVLALLDATGAFPLVGFRSPPEDLRAYARDYEAGAETVGQLLEYAEFSRSKLDHYVTDPDALKRNVATHRTSLRRLDADPLTVDWPPPEPDVLGYRCRELTGVVGRVVDRLKGLDGVTVLDADPDDATARREVVDPLVALREVRALPRETDYERLRDSARARAQLGADERERLASGAVAEELAARRETLGRLADALDEHPPL